MSPIIFQFINKAACYVTWFVYVLFQYCVAISDARYPLAILIINIILVTLIQIISCEGDSKTAIFRSGIFYATWMAIEVASKSRSRSGRRTYFTV